MTNKISNSKIEQHLEELVNVPPRNPQQATRGRAQFLNQAANYRQTVSREMYARQRGWNFLFRKERRAMNVMVSLILAVALILGGGATTVAAQDDLPTEPLYPLKLWTENARLSLAGDPQEKANLLMQMSQTRLEEIAALAEMGVTPPKQVQEQLALRLEQTLRLAAGMDDAVMTQTLTQLREHLQTQEQTMLQLQTQANPENEPLLIQIRQMMQNRLRLVELGLEDPQGFRYRMTNNMMYGQDEGATPEPNQQGEPGFHQNDEAEQPGNGNENQNQNNEQNGPETVAPGNQEQNNESNGPGAGIPGGRNQDDSGDDSSNGQGNGSQQDDNGSGSGGGGNDSGGCGGCGGGNGGGGNK